jgi:hypothetical protein
MDFPISSFSDKNHYLLIPAPVYLHKKEKDGIPPKRKIIHPKMV